jgi:hypothetical protein
LYEPGFDGPYWVLPVDEVVQQMVGTRGEREIQQVFQVPAVRKSEVLPVVREELRSGDLWDKHTMAKHPGYSPWTEARHEMVERACLSYSIPVAPGRAQPGGWQNRAGGGGK